MHQVTLICHHLVVPCAQFSLVIANATLQMSCHVHNCHLSFQLQHCICNISIAAPRATRWRTHPGLAQSHGLGMQILFEHCAFVLVRRCHASGIPLDGPKIFSHAHMLSLPEHDIERTSTCPTGTHQSPAVIAATHHSKTLQGLLHCTLHARVRPLVEPVLEFADSTGPLQRPVLCDPAHDGLGNFPVHALHCTLHVGSARFTEHVTEPRPYELLIIVETIATLNMS
jgi:hypothetical protein